MSAGMPCVATAEVLHGKELSFNNILDLDMRPEPVAREFAYPAAVVIKHNNPCGGGRVGVPAGGKAFQHGLRGRPGKKPTAACSDSTANWTRPTAKAGHRAEPLHRMRHRPRLSATAAFAACSRRARSGRRASACCAPARCMRAAPAGERWCCATWTAACCCRLPTTGGPEADFQDAKTMVTKRPPTAAEIGDLRFAWSGVQAREEQRHRAGKDGMVVGVGRCGNGPGGLGRTWRCIRQATG